MSITKTSDFFEDSFKFEDPVKDRLGSERIGLAVEGGGPLLLKLEDCLAYGIRKNNKFGKDNYIIPLAVGSHTEFVSALKTLEKRCAETVGGSYANVVRCFYRVGKEPVLYAKIDKSTVMYGKDGDMNPMEERDEHFYLDALIGISSVYVKGDMASVQVKLQEARYLRVRPAEPWKRILLTCHNFNTHL